MDGTENIVYHNNLTKTVSVQKKKIQDITQLHQYI